LLRHVKELNRHDPSAFLPFTSAGRTVGLIRRDLVRDLAPYPRVFAIADSVALNGRDHDERSALLREAVEGLAAEGRVSLRGEPYPLLPGWGEELQATLDRGAADFFGILAYGVHVNGITMRGGRRHMWVGRRALDRPGWPGKLDNMIGGGCSAGYTAREILVKEAMEEAGFEEILSAAAISVGIVRYVQDSPQGVSQHTLFLYDLEVPEGIEPRNTDGEVAEFLLLPVEEVADLVMQGGQFKENCNLVIIDFLIRHGYLTPETAGYERLTAALKGRE
jgi:8-oxo-dGTP pyrophosphatase MutT (NUDIX family)